MTVETGILMQREGYILAMSNAPSKRIRNGVIVALLPFVLLGVVHGGGRSDPWLIVMWLWTGFGLAIVYLLYRLVVAVDRVGTETPR